MTTHISRRALLLGAASLAGCQLAAKPNDTLQPADQETLTRFASALNNMLMERSLSAPGAFEGAGALLAAMKEVKPLNDKYQEAFEQRKLQYVAVAASHALEQGAGSLVVKIATVFPQITYGTIAIDGIGNYSLKSDLAANYAKTGNADEPLQLVQDQLAAIRTRYLSQFDDGLSAAKKWVPAEDPGMPIITPEQLLLKKSGWQRM